MPRIKKKVKQVSKEEEEDDQFKMFSSSEDEDKDGEVSQAQSALSDLSDILSTSQASLWEESDPGPLLKNTDDAVFRKPAFKLTKKQLEEEDKRRRRDSLKIIQAANKSHEYNKSKNSSSNNPQLQLQQEDLRRLYSTALQLFGNKKITKDNAFSLKLLDCFGSLVKKDLNTDGINTVARALEACTRIFTCRVDLAHSTLRRITNDIIHKNVGKSDDSSANHHDSSANQKDDLEYEQGFAKANKDAPAKAVEPEDIPFEIDLNDPISYCGFDENGDEIIENDDENMEGGQEEGKAGAKKKKVLPGCIETNEYNLSLESEVSKDTESHALKKFKAQFHDSIKTRKPDDFFFQYEKLVPSYTARLEDPDTLREEKANLLEPVNFPKSLALTDDLVELPFYDLKLDIDFDPTIHNIWGYERRDSDDEEGNASSIAIGNGTVIENEANDIDIPCPDLQYDINDRPNEYPESSVGAGPSDITDFRNERDEMTDNEGEEQGISIANIKNLDQLEAYFNKIRATKDKKVDIFRIFANNLTSGRQKVNKPTSDVKDKSIVAPQPLTIKDLSIFSNKYKSSWRNNLNLNINKEEWGNFDSMVPMGSYQELNDLEFPQYAELSKSIDINQRNGKRLLSKEGQTSNTKEHYRYFMDKDRNILEIMKKHPKGYKNITQIKEFLQEEKDEEDNENNSIHEDQHFEGFEPDDGDFAGFEGGVRNKDEYCYDNPWMFGDFPDKNDRLVFDRKSGGFVDLANLDSECFEEGNEFTTAHSDIMNIAKPAVDMHFLKTVIEGILKKRFDKNSPLKDDDYTFDELITDIWKGNYLENAHDHVSPSMTLASFLHVCTDCGFSIERVVGADCGYESEVMNDDEKENVSATGKDASHTSVNGATMEREILFIRPPKDVDFVPSSF